MNDEIQTFIKDQSFSLCSQNDIERGYLIGESDGKYLIKKYYANSNNNVYILDKNGSMRHELLIRSDLFTSVKYNESIVIVDPDRSVYDRLKEKLQEEKYDIKVINMDFSENRSDAGQEVSWNFMEAIKNDPEAAVRISSNIIANTSSGRLDRFYQYSEQCLLAAIMIYVAKSGKIKENKRNIFTVLNILKECKEEDFDYLFFDCDVKEAEKYYELYKLETEMVDKNMIAGLLRNRFCHLPVNNVTKKFFCENTIDLKAPLKKKCAYFIVTSERNSACHFIWDLFITEMLEVWRNTEPKDVIMQVNLILDHFYCFGKIGENQDGKDFVAFLQDCYKYNIRTTIVSESIVHMRMRYPGHFWHDIVTACPLKLVTGVRDQTSAMYVARKTKNYDFEDLLCLSNKKLLVFYKNSNILINKAVF